MISTVRSICSPNSPRYSTRGERGDLRVPRGWCGPDQGDEEVAGSLRLDLATLRELEAFAQLGAELDAASQQQLDRGARMVELLKQGQFTPFDTIDQCISIYAASRDSSTT